MRKILYKGKQKNNNEWYYGYLFDDGMIDSNRIFIGNIVIEDYKGYADDKFNITGIDFCEVDPETVCQYTGLDDKNGTKIFESDIVSVPMRGYYGKTTNEIGIVEWINGAFSVKWEKEEYGRHFAGYLEGIEVIGNIFDGIFDGK